jgi:electron transport complex protein RnfB
MTTVSEPVTPTPAIVAFIDESACIGCTLCIQACPVDAILGAAKLMHTVIRDECTGCELCLPPCPVDCIHMLPAPERLAEPETDRRARVIREERRSAARDNRLARQRDLRQRTAEQRERRAYIAAAVARVKARKSRTRT